MNYFASAMTTGYFDFKGRASRSEYWYFQLFASIIFIFIGLLLGFSGVDGENAELFILVLAIPFIIPSFSVSVRRLHDIGKSGRLLLVSFIPLIGAIFFLFWAIQPSQEGSNKYGESPK